MVNTSSSPTNTTQESEYDPVSQQEATANLIWQVFPPILIIVGTVGNIMSIIVLSRKAIRKSGVSRYLICLAVTDLLVLYTGLLRQWIMYTFTIDIRDRDSFICKVSLWMVYFSLDLSAWILVSVTVERAFSVWRPLQVRSRNSKKVFVVNIVVLVVLLLLINGHFLFGFDVVGSEADGHECGSLSVEYEQFQSRVFPWIDLFLFCIGPFFCHLVGNTVLIIGLVKTAVSMGQYNLNNTELVEDRHRQTSSMTVLLLCMNAIYVVCTLPISMFFIQDAIYLPKPTAQRRLVYACVNLLMYLNNSTNFLTYMASGRRFRAELYALFCRKPQRPTPNMTLSASRSSLSTSQTLASSYSATII